MQYVLALLVGSSIAVWLYHRFAVDRDSPYGTAITGAGGAATAVVLLWLFQTGLGRALSMMGTAFVLLVFAVTVIPVVAISLLSVRKINDVRISTKLRWERSHPRASNLHADNEE